MATVTGLTAERMQEIIDATIVDADIVADHLILTKDDGSTIDAGVVSDGVLKAAAFPALPTDGDMVVRTDQSGDPLYKYTDGAWQVIGGGQILKAAAFPTVPAPTDGDVVIRTDQAGDPLYKYTDGAWVQLVQVGGAIGSDPLWTMDIDPFAPNPAQQTNFNTVVVDNLSLHCGWLQSSGAQNDQIGWDVYLEAGTYDVGLIHCKDANRGIYNIQIDGVTVGTIDGYNAGGISRNNRNSTATFNIATSGKKRLNIKMATKQAASQYYGSFQSVHIRRTA